MKNKDKISQTLPNALLWSLWLLTAAITFKLFSELIADYDLWFHLFLGREAFSNAAIGKIDVYSFTAYGLPVINHEWFADQSMIQLLQSLPI